MKTVILRRFWPGEYKIPWDFSAVEHNPNLNLKTQTASKLNPSPHINIFLSTPDVMLYLFLTLVRSSRASSVCTILPDPQVCTGCSPLVYKCCSAHQTIYTLRQRICSLREFVCSLLSHWRYKSCRSISIILYSCCNYLSVARTTALVLLFNA